MSGVLYSSRISSLVQSYRGARAFTARHTAPWASGAGGGVVAIGEKESLTGVLNALMPPTAAVVVARRHRAGARLGSRLSDMDIDRSGVRGKRVWYGQYNTPYKILLQRAQRGLQHYCSGPTRLAFVK